MGEAAEDSRGWRIVAALAVTQTVGYGVLYYSFPVLLLPMSRSLHASTTAVTGALTTSMLAGAVMAVPVGRWLDRRGGRGLMTAGSAAATALLVCWSRVDTVAQLYVVLTGIGITGAMVLYEPAFAVVVSWFGPQRRARAVLAVVAVAGLASAIFMPLTGVLVDRLGWRTAVVVLAALHGALTVPLHALAVRRPPWPRSTGRPTRHQRAGAVRAALRDPRFWWLATAFVSHGAAMSTMTVHLVSHLVRQGHPATFAASVAGLLGLLSVTGRLLLTGLHRWLSLTVLVAVVFAVQAAAAVGLVAVGGSRAGAVLAVVAFGVGFGAASLVTPILLSDRYGTAAYATIAGMVASPTAVARATAPLGAAGLLAATGSYPAVLLAVGAACLVAAVGIAAPAGRSTSTSTDRIGAARR